MWALCINIARDVLHPVDLTNRILIACLYNIMCWLCHHRNVLVNHVIYLDNTIQQGSILMYSICRRINLCQNLKDIIIYYHNKIIYYRLTNEYIINGSFTFKNMTFQYALFSMI